MLVYHRTSKDAAELITRDKTFTSLEQGYVFVSNVRDGYADGYGNAVVVLDVPPARLILDDEFQTGECHYRIHVSQIEPCFIIGKGEI